MLRCQAVWLSKYLVPRGDGTEAHSSGCQPFPASPQCVLPPVAALYFRKMSLISTSNLPRSLVYGHLLCCCLEPPYLRVPSVRPSVRPSIPMTATSQRARALYALYFCLRTSQGGAHRIRRTRYASIDREVEGGLARHLFPFSTSHGEVEVERPL